MGWNHFVIGTFSMPLHLLKILFGIITPILYSTATIKYFKSCLNQHPSKMVDNTKSSLIWFLLFNSANFMNDQDRVLVIYIPINCVITNRSTPNRMSTIAVIKAIKTFLRFLKCTANKLILLQLFINWTLVSNNTGDNETTFSLLSKSMSWMTQKQCRIMFSYLHKHNIQTNIWIDFFGDRIVMHLLQFNTWVIYQVMQIIQINQLVWVVFVQQFFWRHNDHP